MKNKNLKYQSISRFVFVLVIIILVNYISSFVFFRLDLTAEKRYSLSDVTKEELKNLDDIFYIKVYLEGDLPIGFQRLNKAIKEMLDEFRAYAGDNIQYEFINPSAEENEEIRNKLFMELYNKGLQPTNIEAEDNEGGKSEKIAFPGALVVYNNIEFPLNLLKNNPGLPAEINLNNSIQSLEYEFMKAIMNLNTKNIPKIAFLEGQGELDELQVGDITRELANYYQVDRGVVSGKMDILDGYKAVIVAKPMEKFSEEDKLVLDQYIMNGGKVLWCIDAVNVNTDSLARGVTFGFANSVNLDDMFFKYGVRVNPDIVKDFQCAILPVNVSLAGDPPKFVPAQWVYFPLIYPWDDNPITKNVNMVKLEFPSSIDTVGSNSKVKKHFLLTTSVSSKIVNVPVMISLDEIKTPPRQETFNNSYQNVAVLLEGEFESVFKNRMVDDIIKGSAKGFKSTSLPTRMVVISDGDIIKNEVQNSAQGLQIVPLGYDRYSRQTFGNKEFLLNVINYLTDEIGLMDLRGREFKLRLLNRAKIKGNETHWRLINTMVPVLIILLFGILYNSLRKRKYSKP